jgi:LuxR family maltose regulon positive regulatory protein
MSDEAHGREPSVLLATKLNVPALSDRLIGRAPLVQGLSAGNVRKLTLLSAPAGWGKTTLLAQWAESEKEHVRFAWLSLDRTDNDPVRFWTYVVAALHEAQPAVAIRASDLLARGGDLEESVLPTLLNELASLNVGSVLVLDDYHLVTNPVVHQQIAFVIDRMPAPLRLVLATRSDPALPLARLRAGGDLLELRADDLRFAAADATVLLNGVLKLDLAQEDIAVLSERTEGWAAGLYLVALSLMGRADTHALIRDFAGDNRHIVDYLSAEVLDGSDLRWFLVRSSLLDKLSGPLCDAVLDISDSAAILERIERGNLFLVPLDSARRWYRYHHLFSELLRSELRRTEPDAVCPLHERAAAWFVANGLIDEAVHHLVGTNDVQGAAALIGQNWATEFNRGRLSTASGWLDRLPRNTVSGDARLCVARAWIALDTGQVDPAVVWIEAAEAAVAAHHADAGNIPADIVVLRAVSRFKIGDIPASLDLARRAVDLDLSDSPVGCPAAYCIYGSALYWSGDTDEAKVAYRRAVQLAGEMGNHLARAYAFGYLALISVEEGRLAEAAQLVDQVTGDSGVLATEHFVDMMICQAVAKILDQRGDTGAAFHNADAAVRLARRGGGLVELANALITRAEIAGRLGDVDAARASLTEAREVLRRCTDRGLARQLLANTELHTARWTAQREHGQVVGEPVTAKELEVLRLLATRMSRREIAERLYVSLNTVKTHQRGLYRKLGVADRIAAVKRGRELGIL